MLKQMIDRIDSMSEVELKAFGDFLETELSELTSMKSQGIFEDQDGLSQGMYEMPNDLNDLNDIPDEHFLFADKVLGDIIDKVTDEKRTKANVSDDTDECCSEAEKPFSPLANICTTSDETIVYLQLQVVGFSEDDITVEVKHDDDIYYIEITGTVGDDVDSDDTYKYDQKEFAVVPFCNTYEISEAMFNGKTTVDMGNGILTISTVPVQPKNTTKKVF